MSDFGRLETLGRACSPGDYTRNETNAARIKETERVLGHSQSARKERVVRERITLLVDPGTFLDLGSLYDPECNPEGATGVITGLAKVHGECVCVIASNPELRKGAWLPGQPQKILRIQRLAELLHTPIMWLLECSGLDLERQDRVYTGHDSGGKIFFNNARLSAKGIPIIAGIFGTNPAGGGYHGISATKRLAHADASMAVGGAAILSGMRSSKSGFSEEDVTALLEEMERISKIPPPGSSTVHTQTGFFDSVHGTEKEVIEAMRSCIAARGADDPQELWDVTDPPKYDGEDLYYLIPHDSKMTYKTEDILARLVDGSTSREYLPGYGPEVYCGVVSVDGLSAGIVANRQGFLPRGYPEYADYPGIGGKLYRQGLVKMCKFVSWCDENKVPMIWLQDTSGIDVGDQAEKAGLLGLGQALIYAIERANIPMATVVLRKGHAASHYVMCGPMASNNALTIGTAVTEVMVMHKETAAIACFGRALKKAADDTERLSVIAKMNGLVEKYSESACPHYVARQGIVDEVVNLSRLREYLTWFLHAAYSGMKKPESVQGLWTLWPALVEKSYGSK
ncbi:glutaconyl-CoA decarboxylase subunit alpha [Candidatus Kaiserbacteria bacterium]|nr:glutaconyl-CoA decarboxylase subunit alpha [Candidatus Kaiserbacteria bacterium]